MKIPAPVKEGKFLKRYKRFFADIEFEGEEITAHVPNTGSLKSCLDPNSKCYFTFVDDPKRKLKYTLQLVKTKTSLVGVNTGLANTLVWEAFENKKVSAWKKFGCGKREVKINDKSRLDLALWKPSDDIDPKKKIPIEKFDEHKFHFIEVKNVTLAEDGITSFPDAVTTRGQKHLEELVNLIKQGHSCELVFVVQRTDCKSFKPADEIDPKYGELLRWAKKEGLIISPYACTITKSKIELDTSKKLKLLL